MGALFLTLTMGALLASPTVIPTGEDKDPCEGAPTLCRRAAQDKILEWRERALIAESANEGCQVGLEYVMTSTAHKEIPGVQLLVAEDERRDEAREDEWGFWQGGMLGAIVGALIAGGAALAVAVSD